eukprot:1160963-Pelagomonas_calceolata.AAC.12
MTEGMAACHDKMLACQEPKCPPASLAPSSKVLRASYLISVVHATINAAHDLRCTSEHRTPEGISHPSTSQAGAPEKHPLTTLPGKHL